jgi:hypothetical protein
MITLGGLVSLVIFFLIVGLVVWLLLWPHRLRAGAAAVQ